MLGTLIKGGGRALEQNLLAGNFWLWASTCECPPYFGRLESKANIADGPTRNDPSALNALAATKVKPKLSECVYDLWNIRTTNEC